MNIYRYYRANVALPTSKIGQSTAKKFESAFTRQSQHSRHQCSRQRWSRKCFARGCHRSLLRVRKHPMQKPAIWTKSHHPGRCIASGTSMSPSSRSFANPRCCSSVAGTTWRCIFGSLADWSIRKELQVAEERPPQEEAASLAEQVPSGC